ncbi:hypothetical protein H4R34_001048 [Dimargaris verticillata]|uniref:RING-type E3 ubiquitin transferase BRCA1 n=1 Tax=Dimargaris verticillata TaxID=2761393 RepID=A0A9W8B5I0_9FUNG|nr:hypothetical protein H4R34_001048 [Dimargaris verticillata]
MALPRQSAQRTTPGTTDSPSRSPSHPAASVSPTVSHGSSERLPTTVAGLLGRLQAEVTCAICLSVLDHPLSTHCNHVFCQDCIHHSLSSKNTACPLCKTPITKRSLAHQEAFGDVAAAVHRVIEAFEHTVGNTLEALLDSPCIDNQLLAEPQPNLSQAYPYPGKELATQGDPLPPSQLTLPAMPSSVPTQGGLLITSSNLSPEHMTALQKLSQRLNIPLTSELSNQTTHLVVEVDDERMATKRTKKYMVAVLRGCWVVSTDWVAACLRQRKRVSEDSFEVLGDSKTTIPGGPRRARVALHSTESFHHDSNHDSAPSALIFQGGHLFSQMHFIYDSPTIWNDSSLADLKECIALAGGHEYTPSESFSGLDLDSLCFVNETPDLSEFIAKQPFGSRLKPAVVLMHNDSSGPRAPCSTRRRHWEKQLGLASRGRHGSSGPSIYFQEAWRAHATSGSGLLSDTESARSTAAVPMDTTPGLPQWCQSAAVATYKTSQGQAEMVAVALLPRSWALDSIAAYSLL